LKPPPSPITLKQIAEHRWKLACTEHVTARNKKLSFERYPFQVQMYQDDSRVIVLMSCVQIGKTEFAIVTTMATMDAGDGINVMYVLPDQTSVSRFVQAKFNRTVSNTRYYDKMSKEVGRVSLKSLGGGFVSIVPSTSDSAFKEYTADSLIFDEFDLCDPENVILAHDRLEEIDDDKLRAVLYIGNPQFKNGPLHEKFEQSDQKYWNVTCEDCGHVNEIDWFKNVLKARGEWYEPRVDPIDVVCDKCEYYLDVSKGHWIARHPGREISGYQFNQIIGGKEPAELWRSFREARFQPTKMQHFYNSYLGLPYTAVGAGVTDDELAALQPAFAKKWQACIAGIDVGAELSLAIGKDVGDALEVLHYSKVPNRNEILRLLNEHDVRGVVIDSEPGGFYIKQWAEDLTSMGIKVLLCRNQESMYEHEAEIDPESGEIRYHRTWLLDSFHSLIKRHQVRLNSNLPEVYRNELQAITRALVQRESGRVSMYRWSKGEDHAFFASAYMMLAMRFCPVYDLDMIRTESVPVVSPLQW